MVLYRSSHTKASLLITQNIYRSLFVEMMCKLSFSIILSNLFDYQSLFNIELLS